jgi:hypothetical protein
MQFDYSCVGTISEIPRCLSLHHWEPDVSVFWTTAHFQTNYSMYNYVIIVQTSIMKILGCTREVSEPVQKTVDCRK